MRRVNNFDELVTGEGFVDCYTSTDVAEVKEMLKKIGFWETELRLKEVSKDRRAWGSEFLDNYQEESGAKLIRDRDCMRIECVDIPADEAQRQTQNIGFPPMSKMRIYVNGRNPSEVLLPIMKCLDGEWQDSAFVGPSYSKAVVKTWSR
ncbi:MAG: hypothetical protein KJ600_00625 [Nanoarchaeota archaeon]|nr:hypothetical protein [Nanoarchaeota archaeon]MBU1103047.1 hypothetical protein [Nanoarchaeota archaeon]